MTPRRLVGASGGYDAAMRIARFISAVIAVGLLVAACSSETPSDSAAPDLRAWRFATLADLVGPWQREPFAIDPGIRAAADRACRADTEFPPGLQLAAIDARGSGRLITVYAGPGGFAECAYTKVNPAGTVTGSLSSTSIGLDDMPAAGQLSRTLAGGGEFSDDAGAAVQYVVGRVGAGAVRVVLDVEGVGPVAASLDDGWYIAWWVVGMRPAGGRLRMQSMPFTVTAYDASAQITDRIESAQ